jgi:hypothetical protein
LGGRLVPGGGLGQGASNDSSMDVADERGCCDAISRLQSATSPNTPSGSNIVIAAEETAPGDAQTNDDTSAASSAKEEESAKMGKEEATGADQATPPESDTKKVDQPPRKNPTTLIGSAGKGANRGRSDSPIETCNPKRHRAKPHFAC